MDDLNWGVVLPLIVIQLILMVIALIDLVRRDAQATRGPKLMWVFIVILGSLVGSIVYFTVGRRNDA